MPRWRAVESGTTRGGGEGCRPQVLPDEHPGRAAGIHGGGEVDDVLLGQNLLTCTSYEPDVDALQDRVLRLRGPWIVSLVSTAAVVACTTARND